ncbi:hypothetical protein [Sphingobacterium corticibacterium]|uniref:Uncharacterized protein n=1 Tax=Sphingobacterium corticibacterium TaxID=2484746 RepID=A0A4Q6XRC1_9SPHI|nr:hypothetical protein [Sphingobacterium corticibacterium]RZF62481.1 hypothetical protein EWE74_06685 [Sphingobacterium corticibacterium]
MRADWFSRHKKEALSKAGYPNITEQFTNTPVKRFLEVIEALSKDSGINVHFAAEKQDEATLRLLFVSADQDFKDVGDYYQLNPDGSFAKIANSIDVEELKNNYKKGIKTVLDKTTDATYGETELVHFNKETISEIRREIAYQTERGTIAGITTKIVSLGDEETEERIAREKEDRILQRLTILFTYVDKNNQETDFETIDRERYLSTIAIQNEGLVKGLVAAKSRGGVSGLNTGDPIPPYPRGNI